MSKLEATYLQLTRQIIDTSTAPEGIGVLALTINDSLFMLNRSGSWHIHVGLGVMISADSIDELVMYYAVATSNTARDLEEEDDETGSDLLYEHVRENKDHYLSKLIELLSSRD